MGFAMTMQTVVQRAVACLITGGVLASAAVVGVAQQRGSTANSNPIDQQTMPKPGAPSRDPIGMGRGLEADPMIDKLQEQQAKTRNSDRQKRLQTDTERLLSLATELKQQVDKTDKNILSLDVIKKA